MQKCHQWLTQKTGKPSLKITDVELPDHTLDFAYKRVNVKEGQRKEKFDMYGLKDVEWIYGNSLKYITLSSDVMCDFHSGKTYPLDILTSQERSDISKNINRRDFLKNEIEEKDNSKE